MIALLVAWFAFLFAFVGFGGTSGSAVAVPAGSVDCASKTAQTRLAPNVRVTAKGTTAPNVQRKRTATPSRSFTDGPRGCGR